MFQFQFQNLSRLDRRIRERIERIADVAERFGENGIVDWALRATADAQALGRLRDRDIANLERIERTFDSDFYNDRGNAREFRAHADPAYA